MRKTKKQIEKDRTVEVRQVRGKSVALVWIHTGEIMCYLNPTEASRLSIDLRNSVDYNRRKYKRN